MKELKDLTIDDVSNEARAVAVAWGEAKHFDMLDTFKLGIDIQDAMNKAIKCYDQDEQELCEEIAQLKVEVKELEAEINRLRHPTPPEIIKQYLSQTGG